MFLGSMIARASRPVLVIKYIDRLLEADSRGFEWGVTTLLAGYHG